MLFGYLGYGPVRDVDGVANFLDVAGTFVNVGETVLGLRSVDVRRSTVLG